MQPRIAIIGAGISGLSCARTLLEHQCHVELFDKGFHTGGRVATRFASRTDSSFYFDHGAQYFTVKTEAFKQQVDSWVKDGVAALWAGRVGKIQNGKLLQEHGAHERFVGTPYMRAVADHMALPLSITTNCRVTRIRQLEKKWRLQFEVGDESPGFDAVVIGIPPLQAANLLQEFSDLQTFCLASKMGACWSTFVSFDSEICLAFDGMFVDDSALSWVCRDSSKPLRPRGERWVLHATPSWTVANIDVDPDEVASQLLKEFFRVTNASPVSSTYKKSHRWLYAIPIETESPRSFQILPSDKLAVCGDWCHGGRVEGAFLSGREAAEALLQAFVIT
jgi:predicted NAD/FAD-dependent oxidoreductase